MENKRKVGRPEAKVKKQVLSCRLSPDVIDFLKSKEHSAGEEIERLVKAAMNEQMDMFK